MNYYELQDLCEIKHKTVTNVARALGITLEGLKRGLNNESLSIRYLKPICDFLEITPNEFFRVGSFGGDIGCNKFGQNQTINQIPTELNETIGILRDQLKEKDLQISMKDEQINKLLARI